MRILLITWYFPPANDVAALRVGKMAEHLRNEGHDVWVLTGARPHNDQSLPVSLPEEHVLRTPWYDIQKFRYHASGSQTRARQTPALAKEAMRHTGIQAIADAVNNFYTRLVQLPDRQIGWIPYAKRAGRALLAKRKFDLIYASGPPFSTFVIAKSLGRQFSIPWIAEYRDGWSRYVYTPQPEWRQAIDSWLETRVSRTAKAIVAVSEPSAAYYRDRFKLPAIAVYNGIDPEDLPANSKRDRAPSRQLSIAYVGSIYKDLRDPAVLYDAIKRSGLSPADLQVLYYGSKPADVLPFAEKSGVSAFVTVKSRVPHRQSLQIQRESDVLLLLQSPKDPGNVPAKVFEYLAARRPILGLGLDEGIPAQIIRERGAGLYVSNAGVIAAQLNRWVAEKKATGSIPDLPSSVHAGLSRAEQFRLLAGLLRSVQQSIGKEQPSPVPDTAS